MNNAIVPTSQPTPDPMNIGQRIARGRAIAVLYIAAQHLSQVASDDACRLIEEANDPWQNYGFNQAMRKSPFGTRAVGADAPQWFLTKESVAQRDERIQRMTTPPWMQLTVSMQWDREPTNQLPI